MKVLMSSCPSLCLRKIYTAIDSEFMWEMENMKD